MGDDKQVREATREAKKTAERDRARKEKRFAELEGKIAEAEGKLAEARAQLAGDHGGAWQKLHALADEEKKLGERVKSLMAEWEKLGTELGQ